MGKVKIKSVGASLLFSFLLSALTVSVVKGFLVNVLVTPIAYLAVQRKIGIFGPQTSVAVGGLAGLFFPPVWHSMHEVLLLTLALYPAGKALIGPLGIILGEEGILAGNEEEGWN